MPDQPENYVHISVALRDYFAAMALQGILIVDSHIQYGVDESDAVRAYRIADLMLAAREKVAS